MKRTAGFTLVELMVAMVVFTLVMGGALSFLRAQSRGFRRGDQEMATMLNLSYGADHLHAQLRTAGANVAFRQPLVVYASANAFAFNADYASNDLADISAVYVDPDASAAETVALEVADQITIPTSAPAVLYPLQNYTAGAGINSPAETITLFFQADAETPRADDFVLLRQVNGQPPEPLVRNVLRDGANQPFFRYLKLRTPAGVAATMVPVAAADLPYSHPIAGHGSTADVGAPTASIDSLRAVQVGFLVTNGQVGALERTQRIGLTIPLPNMGLRDLKICGGTPVLGQPLVAAFAVVAGVKQVTLTWNRAFDENLGEKDVVRYVLWRRDVTDPDWADPLASVAATGAANYTHVDADLVAGTTYEYRLSAQDCTPRLSAVATSNQVIVP
jgi:prepilin-type N-terminal cleavage/methylation domain-containing protein